MEKFTLENDIKGIKLFLSGSEASLFVYQYLKYVALEKDTLFVSDFPETSPIQTLSNWFPQKLKKYFNLFFSDSSEADTVTGFDTIYDAQKVDVEIINDPNKILAVVPLARAVHIIVNKTTNVMADPQDIIILPKGSEVEFGLDEGTEPSPILVAKINA